MVQSPHLGLNMHYEPQLIDDQMTPVKAAQQGQFFFACISIQRAFVCSHKHLASILKEPCNIFRRKHWMTSLSEFITWRIDYWKQFLNPSYVSRVREISRTLWMLFLFVPKSRLKAACGGTKGQEALLARMMKLSTFSLFLWMCRLTFGVIKCASVTTVQL